MMNPCHPLAMPVATAPRLRATQGPLEERERGCQEQHMGCEKQLRGRGPTCPELPRTVTHVRPHCALRG